MEKEHHYIYVCLQKDHIIFKNQRVKMEYFRVREKNSRVLPSKYRLFKITPAANRRVFCLSSLVREVQTDLAFIKPPAFIHFPCLQFSQLFP